MVADPITALRHPPPTTEEIDGLASRIADLIVSEGASSTLALAALATTLGATLALAFEGRDRDLARLVADAFVISGEQGAMLHG